MFEIACFIIINTLTNKTNSFLELTSHFLADPRNRIALGAFFREGPVHSWCALSGQHNGKLVHSRMPLEN